MKTKTKANGAPASPTTNPNPQPEEQAQQPAAIDNDVDSGGDGPYDLFDPEFDEPAETAPRSRFLDPEAQAHVDRAFPERPRTAAVPVAVPAEKAPKGGFWAGVKRFFKGAWWLIEFVLALGASWGLGSLFAMAFTPTVMDFLYSTGHHGVLGLPLGQVRPVV